MLRWKQAPSPPGTKARSVSAAIRAWPNPEDLPVTCDPYLTWAVASQWRGEARSLKTRDFKTDGQRIRVLLRAPSLEVLKQLSNHKEDVSIAPMYLEDAPGEPIKERCRFATATLRPSFLPKLLNEYPQVAFELAAAVRDQGGDLKGDAKGYFGQQTDLDIESARQQVSRGLQAAAIAKTALDAKTAPVIAQRASAPGSIGVFDYGCPFLRDEFMLGNQVSTRVAALWHQENFRVEEPWSVPEGLPNGHSGRQLKREQLDALIQLSHDPDADADEASIYSGLNYLIEYAHPRRRVYSVTHGAHVLDMAGGSCDPLFPEKPVDAAGQADLLFVQMPEDTAGDSSAASLGACLLDALRYMLRTTSPERPLVVNVSFGTTAGPHDGSSLIEQAMDNLLEQRPRNFAVVLAAGNSRRLGLHCRRIAAPKRSALFRIQVMPGDRTDTFVEFWYARDQELKFRVRLPSGDWSNWVDGDQTTDLLDDAGQDVVASLIHRRQVPNGQRAMALLALRPTETPSDDEGPLAPPGPWEVEVSVVPGAQDPVVVDAWIKRDDSRPFSGKVQSSFTGLDRSDEDNTLNGLATGRRTIVASGFRWSDGLVVDYASRGPRSNDQLPLVYGLCEWDSIDAGVRAAAVRSGETRLMNGTSVAAPVVARQVFNLFAESGETGLSKEELFNKLEEAAKQRGSPLRMGER